MHSGNCYINIQAGKSLFDIFYVRYECIYLSQNYHAELNINDNLLTLSWLQATYI